MRDRRTKAGICLWPIRLSGGIREKRSFMTDIMKKKRIHGEDTIENSAKKLTLLKEEASDFDFSEEASPFRERLKKEFLKKAAESDIIPLRDEELEVLKAARGPAMQPGGPKGQRY